MRGRTFVWSAWIEVDEQRPDGFAFNLHWKQIRTFPYTSMCSGILSEFTFLLPVFEVGRGIKMYPVEYRQSHDPLTCLGMPHDFGITKVADAGILEYWISFILLPSDTIIEAVCNPLGLKIIATLICHCLIMVGENGNEGNLPFWCESGCVVNIHYSTSGKDCSKAVWIQCNALMFPRYHIHAGGMAPVHRSPNRSIGIVLIEKMVYPIVVNHAIGVVHPSLTRCEMDFGPMDLIGLNTENLCLNLPCQHQDYSSCNKLN